MGKHNDLMMRGHWEQVGPDGEIADKTNDYEELAERICTDLRRQAVGLLGKGIRVDYSTLTARHPATGGLVRFVGKYI